VAVLLYHDELASLGGVNDGDNTRPIGGINKVEFTRHTVFGASFGFGNGKYFTVQKAFSACFTPIVAYGLAHTVSYTTTVEVLPWGKEYK
jgi:hypothetical protein